MVIVALLIKKFFCFWGVVYFPSKAGNEHRTRGDRCKEHFLNFSPIKEFFLQLQGMNTYLHGSQP
jgi:hypothetical protein